MSTKPLSAPQMRRKIERLEAQLQAAREREARHMDVYRRQSEELIDLRLRITQSAKILLGEDEA